jgi:hypothetical protein
MSALQFDPIAHKYSLNGKVLPSVTQITGSLVDYSMVPSQILERKKQIGVATHLACEYHDKDGVDEGSIQETIYGFFSAYKRFGEENPYEVLLNEGQFASERYGFAGTPDRVLRMLESRKNSWAAGDVINWDLKTVAQLHPATALQTAGYKLLLPDLGVPRSQIKRGAIQLKPDGSYHLELYSKASDEPTFLACLIRHNWKVENNV